MRKRLPKRIVHEPVLVKEVLKAFALEKKAPLKTKARYIDATLGNAGHSQEIVKRKGEVLGIETDRQMLEIAKKNIKKACPVFDICQRPYRFVKGNFKDLAKIAKENKFLKVRGILFDLGASTHQLLSEQRGFSFQHPQAPLDMRFDIDKGGVKASDLLNCLRKDQLQKVFNQVLDKRMARKLAEGVIKGRLKRKYQVVADFLETLKKINSSSGKLHPATKAFLALRMAVNSELENLKQALPQAFKLLDKKGRLVVISFHSGEDRIVKHFYKKLAGLGKARIVNKKPIRPSMQEILKNPKSRSAKLRILEKN